MKKSLTRIFSFLLAAATALSTVAAPTAPRKLKAPVAESRQLTVSNAKIQPKSASKAPKNGKALMPKVKKASAQNVFKQARKNANVPFKAPYKAASYASQVDSRVNLYGGVIWSDDESMGYGLYKIPTADNQSFDLIVSGANGEYGGVLLDDTYYTCEVTDFLGIYTFINYVGYDITTGEEVYNQSYTYQTYSMTYDETTSKVYGLATVEGSYALVKITFDESEVQFEEVGQIGKPANLTSDNYYMVFTIACSPTGELYAIAADIDNNENVVGSYLYQVDKTTAAFTLIGSTGQLPYYYSDGTFDTVTGKFYWTLSPNDDTGWLCEVNTTTGAATRVYQFPNCEEVCGVVSPRPSASANAPSAVENVKIEFTDNALTGTVSFTAPSTLYDGSAASGEVTYTVLANNENVATGTTEFGAATSAEVTLESGLYTFEVYVSNAAGDGPKTKIKNIYVGNDTPAAPSVTATYDSAAQTATVNWTAVTGTVNGGYMNAEGVTYTVTRQPDGVAVATGITATTVTDALTVPDGIVKYTYEVVAECEGMKSQPGVSNSIVLGTGFVPPFVDDFSDGIDGYTVIDANGDKTTWVHNGDHARVAYNSSLSTDDWLISPAIKLQGGKLYDVVADIYGGSSSTYIERVEVKLGKSATVAGMTEVVLEPTVIACVYTDPYKMSSTIMVEEDGEYYIGFHGISDADQYYLAVDNFGVNAPRSTAAPAAATDLKVTPDADGGLSTVVTFTAPDKAINGNTLTSLEKIELTRDGALINTWTAPAPGASLSYSDVLTAGGNVLYSVTAYNAEGVGAVAEQSVFVGIDIPAAPMNITVTELGEPGVVTISWDAVTTDVNGLKIPASQIKYQVYSFDGTYREAVSEKISETTFTYQALEAGQQTFMQFLVFAYNGNDEGEGNISDLAAVGTPYTKFSMTDQNDLNTYILGTSKAGGGEWKLATDATFSDVTSVEGDNMFLYMTGKYIEDYATLFTGKIDLSNTANPAMVFYIMPVGEVDLNKISLDITDISTGVTTNVYDATAQSTGAEMEWNKVTVDLSAFAGKTVQATFTGKLDTYIYILFDGWKLVSMVDYDLAVDGITAPGKVNAGNAYAVDVTVINNGSKEAANFSVELYADGELSATKTVTSLASGAKTVVTFDTEFSAIATEAVTYSAKVVYAADQYADNNESDTVTVTPVISTLPAATDLAGTSADGGVKLTWSEPDLANAPHQAVTEDFEDATAFSDSYGDWIFVDGDQQVVGGIENYEIPNITVGVTKGSFWVWDYSQAPVMGLEGHSGTKFLFSMYNYDDSTVNDWAISPELDGSAQTVTFYAKSYSGEYPEKIEVYYSTGSTSTSDFVKVAEVGGTVPDEWTLYSAELPEGAKRVAIRSCSTGAFILLIDDVTFIPANAPAQSLEIKGYDVYRDGVKITESPVEGLSYVDFNVEDGKTYEYVVVTVYATGNSAPSDAVKVLFDASGIELITADSIDAEFFNLQGQRVANPSSGIYIMLRGNTVKKVLVK
ncbi:MAG: hypothetical protein HDS56_04845 [Barnesiella sp.]|nr:hypothetical protein [Barnesiella sp.]